MSDEEATELLIRARGFIERGWCRFAFAQDAAGNEVSPLDVQAVAWCAWGALFAAGLPETHRTRHPAFHRLRAAIDGNEPIGVFNTQQETVEPVLAAFDRAIAGEQL
jgi:hypothetical protein